MLERQKQGWIEVAKQAERRRCGHHELEQPLEEGDCVLSVVDPKGSGTNKNRYVVAVQEMETRQRLRKVAGVPLIYINKSVMILEPMGLRSTEVRDADERAKVRAGLKGRRSANGTPAAITTTTTASLKRAREDEDDEDLPARVRALAAAEAEEGEQEQEPAQKKRKVRGPKQPNPMSVKKKSTTARPGGGKGEKSAGREVEDERSAIRKASKSDPQAGEKAVDAHLAAGLEGEGDGDGDGAGGGAKRKRKRKKTNVEGGVGGGGDAAVGGSGDAVIDAIA